jgi:hypothetical protein
MAGIPEPMTRCCSIWSRLVTGTVADATAGGFTVNEPGGTHVRVTTSGATHVVMLDSVAVTGLRTGQQTVAVGSVTGKRELAARTVEQENLSPGALFSGLGCNAPAIAATGMLAFGG